MMSTNAKQPPGWPWENNWLELASVPEPFRTFLQQVQEFAESLILGTPVWDPPPKLAQSIYGMTADFELYSEAKRTSLGSYAIAMDGGAPIQLWDTFQRMLSNPEVLPDIGEAPQDYFGKPALMLFGPITFAEGVKALKEGDENQPPLGDAERTSVLKLLIHRSLQFMYLHEVCHIFEGHCDYLKTSFTVPKRIRRAFEHIADAKATGFALLFESLASRVQGTQFPRLKTDGYRLWGFSIATWYHLVEAVEDQAGVGTERSYPRATLRSVIANASPLGGPVDYVTNTRQEVFAQISRGFNEAHDAWAAMGWGKRTELTDDEVNQAFAEIEEAERLVRSSSDVQ